MIGQIAQIKYRSFIIFGHNVDFVLFAWKTLTNEQNNIIL